MTHYVDPFTLEEAMKEIKALRVRTSVQKGRIAELESAMREIKASAGDPHIVWQIARAALQEKKP